MKGAKTISERGLGRVSKLQKDAAKECPSLCCTNTICSCNQEQGREGDLHFLMQTILDFIAIYSNLGDHNCCNQGCKNKVKPSDEQRLKVQYGQHMEEASSCMLIGTMAECDSHSNCVDRVFTKLLKGFAHNNGSVCK